MKEVISPQHGLTLNEANLFGVVSLIVWGLILIVSLKYVTLVLRANNGGEGGIMALTALALSAVSRQSHCYYPVLLLGMIGDAMFYGDCVITPDLSVLSAIEGIEGDTPAI